MGREGPEGEAAMTTKALAATLLLSVAYAAAGGAVAEAQETTPETPAVERDDEEAPPDTRRPLRVLENPYDISSFYRSSDGLVFGPQGGASDRYPIAGFYRQRGGSSHYGYSQFWTSGYSDRRGRGRGTLGIGFRRSIGENGDLFLFAPAILAPVGPLTGVFFDGITLR
jgi:hypothetical protein